METFRPHSGTLGRWATLRRWGGLTIFMVSELERSEVSKAAPFFRMRYWTISASNRKFLSFEKRTIYSRNGAFLKTIHRFPLFFFLRGDGKWGVEYPITRSEKGGWGLHLSSEFKWSPSWRLTIEMGHRLPANEKELIHGRIAEYLMEELPGNIEGLLPPWVFDAPMICLLNGISIQ